MTVRLEILGDDGEWHEVPGIRSVELHQEQPDVPPDDAYWQRHEALDSLHFMTTGFQDARRPRVIDQDGNPVRPDWQSPYGPARRRP
jgi:hypothetical protein